MSLFVWRRVLNPSDSTHSWPFLISQWRDGTLAYLIANPLAWSQIDRIASLLQRVRVLRMAADRGIRAHQDLKPENVFFVDIYRKYPEAIGRSGMHFQILLGDFGNADAFRYFGRNTGRLPFMAPEQFQDSPLAPIAGPSIDAFAVGFIAYEAFCDGRHPIGEITSDVWPRTETNRASRKWGEARTWRAWAEDENKDLALLQRECPETLIPLLTSAMATDPARRSNLEHLERALWETLDELDKEYCKGLRLQIEDLERMYSGND